MTSQLGEASTTMTATSSPFLPPPSHFPSTSPTDPSPKPPPTANTKSYKTLISERALGTKGVLPFWNRLRYRTKARDYRRWRLPLTRPCDTRRIRLRLRRFGSWRLIRRSRIEISAPGLSSWREDRRRADPVAEEVLRWACR